MGLDLDATALLRSRVVGAKKRTLLAVSALVLLWLVGNSLLGGGSSGPPATELPEIPPASKTGGAAKVAAYRVPEGWETLDTTPGFGGLARKVQDPRTGVVFILVEPGSFMMGSPDGEGCADEHPQHEVRITKPFYLAETETTIAQWRRFVAETGYENKGSGKTEKRPVAEVNWDDARAFCEHHGYRLPTEAEWEYACRAGTTGQRYGKLNEIAWYDDLAGGAHPVKEKKPNPWGFHDMLGNVWEWCADAYERDFYRRKIRDDPFVAVGLSRVLRGGAWGYGVSGLRCSNRNTVLPSGRLVYGGFRCARGL